MVTLPPMTTGSETGRPELVVPGVPETRLSDALLARLGPNIAPAPWQARCRALLWWSRGGESARRALPPSLRRHRAIAVVGGLVRYVNTPVGSYDEVFGLVVLTDGRAARGTVAFMAVDGEETLVSGRTNWALPKCLAAFSGDIAGDSMRPAMAAHGVDGSAWSVSASAQVIGPTVTKTSTAYARQEFYDGTVRDSRLFGRFRLRPAIVNVAVSSSGPLPTWLRPGRHLGMVAPEISFHLGAPELAG